MNGRKMTKDEVELGKERGEERERGARERGENRAGCRGAKRDAYCKAGYRHNQLLERPGWKEQERGLRDDDHGDHPCGGSSRSGRG